MGLKFSIVPEDRDGFDISPVHNLAIEKDNTMKVSDYVIEKIKSLGVDKIFSVCGGGAMHLVDSAKDVYVATHHEQAAAMAAEQWNSARDA